MGSHPIVHVDIPVTNPSTDSAFYADVFGWQVHTDQQFDYTMFQAEGGPGGGFTQDGLSVGPLQSKIDSLLVYIGTDDIDASLADVVKHGGSILQPKDEIPGSGWLAVFIDPSGNRIGLYQSQH